MNKKYIGQRSSLANFYPGELESIEATIAQAKISTTRALPKEDIDEFNEEMRVAGLDDAVIPVDDPCLQGGTPYLSIVIQNSLSSMCHLGFRDPTEIEEIYRAYDVTRPEELTGKPVTLHQYTKGHGGPAPAGISIPHSETQ